MKLRSAAIAGGLVVGGLVAVPTAAFAAKSDCPSQRWCAWNGADYINGVKIIAANTPSMSDFHDVMSSWVNNFTTKDVTWYYDNNYTGSSRCTNSSSFSNYVGSTDNDRMDSVAVHVTNTVC